MELNGCLFDLERFSTVDGPGIRTVAFFKGCNMHCWWCHNPEGLLPRTELLFDSQKCIGCGECARVCPKQAHQMVQGQHTLQREKCDECFSCVPACAANALETVGKRWTVDQLCQELLLDRIFFRESGGGVTLSGGEVMCQSAFALAVLRRLRQENIQTALETNLCFPFSRYQEILTDVDILMFDLKCVDEKQHFQGTGISNRLILENAARLASQEWKGLPLIVRTPVIPGFNDKPEMIVEIASQLTGHRNLLYYELLAYHPLGVDKARKLGHSHEPATVPLPPSQDKMLELGRAAAKVLPHVQINGISI